MNENQLSPEVRAVLKAARELRSQHNMPLPLYQKGSLGFDILMAPGELSALIKLDLLRAVDAMDKPQTTVYLQMYYVEGRSGVVVEHCTKTGDVTKIRTLAKFYGQDAQNEAGDYAHAHRKKAGAYCSHISNNCQ